MIDITDDNFEKEVMQADKVVFVDCYAEWCGPCKALKPLLKTLEEKNADKMILGMLNIDDNPKSVEKLNVTSIPKVVVFKNGEEVTQMLGLHPKKDYLDIIDSLLKE